MKITVIPEEVQVVQEKKIQLELTPKEVSILKAAMGKMSYGYDLYLQLSGLMDKENIKPYRG